MLQPPLLQQPPQALHPPRKSLPRNVLEITVRRESLRYIEVRKRRRDFFQPQIAALGNRHRARQYIRRVLEHAQHLVAVLHKKLVALKLHPVRVQNRLPHLDAQHHVLRVRVVLAKVVAVVSRHQRYAQVLLQLKQSRMDAVFHLQALVLNLQKKILPPKQIAIKRRRRPRRLVLPFRQPLRHLALQASRKPDQSARVLRQKFLAHPRLVIKPVQRGLRRNLHQVPVAFLVLGQHQQMVVSVALRRRPPDIVIIFLADVQLAAHNRLHACLLCRVHKMHRAKNVPVIGHRHGRHAELFYALHQFFNVASAVEHRIIAMQM